MIEKVRKALGGTSNSSAPGPDGINYKLLKVIKDTLQEYGILPHSRTYYCLLFSLYHMFIVFVISY